MAIGLIVDIPGLSKEQDEQLFREMGVADRLAPGALVRLRGLTDTGRRVIAAWESREAWEQFRKNTVEPAFQRIGVQAPNFQLWELRDIRVAPGAAGRGGGVFVMMGESPRTTAEQQDEITREAGVADAPPPGGLGRLSGPTETGWRVVSFWESREAAEGFRRDRLEPAFQRLGRPLPSVEFWQADDFRVAPAAVGATDSRG